MLDGPGNYKMWRSTIKSVLEKEDLWEVVVSMKNSPWNIQTRSLIKNSDATLGSTSRELGGSEKGIEYSNIYLSNMRPSCKFYKSKENTVSRKLSE